MNHGMNEGTIERYLAALVAGDWQTFADCLVDDGFTRVGPFGDVKATKAEYVAFLSDLMPTLPGYSMDLTRVTYAGALAFAELSETVEVEGTPLRTPECLTFELADDGRIQRVEVFTQTRVRRRVVSTTRSSLAHEVAVFAAPDFEGLDAFFAEHGFAIMRGLFREAELQELERELERQQELLLAGELPERCGTVILDDPDAVIDGEPFAHYVCHLTEVSPFVRAASYQPAMVEVVRRLLGPVAWLLEDDRFGVVYQDARPGEQSGYSRIGWHSDHQSGPHLDIWPSVAFTIHVDGTSPQNGFLRVLPGSHRGGTEEMPLGFEHVPGELALYCERGDVLLHHSDLWHGAARATEDGDAAIRRHVRGSWYGGEPLAPNHGLDDFVKNARR